jgi:hypothetical protein
MKQVRYFEAIYKGKLEQHYTKDTEDFENWISILNHFDKNLKITYTAYDDGSTNGTAVDYTVIK